MDALEVLRILLEGNAAEVDKAVASDSFLKVCDQPLSNGQYVLHALASKRNAKGVEVLLKHGVGVNQESEEPGNSLGFTAAHYAAACNAVAVLEVLRAYGADFNRAAADTWTPLHVATFRGQSEAMQKLVEFGADINCENAEGHTPLVFAVNLGRLKAARYLLALKASIQVHDLQQDTLLHYALHYRVAQKLTGQYKLPDSQLDMAVLVVLNGVRPDARNADGDVPARYVEPTLPSLPKALSLLFDNAVKLLVGPKELNYLTLVGASQEFYVKEIGLPEEAAKQLVEAMRALEAERKPRYPSTAAVLSSRTEADSTNASALPAGHPTVPAEYMSLPSGDPTNGKCPFLARAAKQQANGHAQTANCFADADAPTCPLRIQNLYKYKGTVLMLTIAFYLGYRCGQSNPVAKT